MLVRRSFSRPMREGMLCPQAATHHSCIDCSPSLGRSTHGIQKSTVKKHDITEAGVAIMKTNSLCDIKVAIIGLNRWLARSDHVH